MDTSDPVVRLCIEGTRAEFEHRQDDAIAFYWQAWKTAKDDYQACIAAHYVARFQKTPQDTLFWNQEALHRANAVECEKIKEFYPSLYLNIGHSFELLGNQNEAKRYFDLVAELGVMHSES